LRIFAKLSIEAGSATAKDQFANEIPKEKDIVSNSLSKGSESPSQVPRSPGLDPTPERGHENGHGGSASHGKSANSISPTSSSQSWLQKSDEPKKGLGLQMLQNLWDDEEAEAAKKSPKMTIEERGSRLRVAEQSKGAASRKSSISSVTSQRSSALATSVPGGMAGPGGSVGSSAWAGLSSGSGSLSGGDVGEAETPRSMLSQLNLSVMTPPPTWHKFSKKYL
jgi:hypothetical protein